MTTFKKGNKFIPRKPKDITKSPAWRGEMDKYDGRELIVDGIDDFGRIQAEESGFMFHPDWCEKVEDSAHLINEATNLFSVEGKWNKVIDWDKRRYELAKDFMAAKIISLVKTDIPWSHKFEVKESIQVADEMIKQLKEQ